jgi:hypothetical protein
VSALAEIGSKPTWTAKHDVLDLEHPVGLGSDVGATRQASEPAIQPHGRRNIGRCADHHRVGFP